METVFSSCVDLSADLNFGKELSRAYRDWSVLTEILRREVLTYPELTLEIANLVNLPVDQNSVSIFLEIIGRYAFKSPFVKKILTKSSLKNILDLGIIDESRIGIDITNTPSDDENLSQNTISNLQAYLTKKEKYLLYFRYKAARDISMLGLVMALNIYSEDSQEIKFPIILENGLRLDFDEDILNRYPELANPETWKRIQHKDRVYFLVAKNGTRLVLKETKHARHSDQSSIHGLTQRSNPDGYTARNSAVQERIIANLVSKYEGDYGMFKIEFEKCLGTVDFPKQENTYNELHFGLYEFMDSMIPLDNPNLIAKLTEAVLKNKSKFANFDKIKNTINQYYITTNPIKALKIWFVQKDITDTTIARIYGIYLFKLIKQSISAISSNLDWRNSDSDGEEVKINSSGDISICFFDFERYEIITQIGNDLKSPKQHIKYLISKAKESVLADVATYHPFLPAGITLSDLEIAILNSIANLESDSKSQL